MERKGEWSAQEELQLLQLMNKYGQDWSSIRKEMNYRSFHGIKVKGRNLLGETGAKVSSRKKKGKDVKKNCNPEFWSLEEHNLLLELHTQVHQFLNLPTVTGLYDRNQLRLISHND